MYNTTKEKDLIQELQISATKSSGPGGQHVNKVSSKITLRFNVSQSIILSADEKQIILNKLHHRLSVQNELIITCQATRSQLRNKNLAIEQFLFLIHKALKPVKPRVKTKRTRASIERRLTSKKQQAKKKAFRRAKDF